MAKKKQIAMGIMMLGVVIGLGAMPFRLEIAPARNFKVLDFEGKPMEGALVRQSCDQYSVGQSLEAEVHADKKGEVLLPRRIVRTRLFSLVMGALRQIDKYGIHASFVSDETITIIVPNHPPHVYFTGKGLGTGKAMIRKGSIDKAVIGSDS